MAATKAKGVVQAVVNKEKKDGGKAWGIIITLDGETGATEYWDSRGNFKDTKPGTAIDFEWEKSSDGKITFINPVGGSQQRGGGGRGSYGRSPEELKQTLRTMVMSYAKDQVADEIHATVHLIKELPSVEQDGQTKQVKYLDFLGMIDKVATTLTIAKYKDILKSISE